MTLAEWMNDHPRLSGEWDSAANESLTPNDVYHGSSKKVWWRCPKGHSWQAAVSSRTTGGKNCPVCAGLQVLTGYNDLATVHPHVLDIWDYDRNKDISPNCIAGNTHVLAWWKCSKGHSWQARVDSLVQLKSGCPYCDGKMVQKGFNDLLFLNSELAQQWCYELNGIGPDEITAGSKKTVWWKCSLGHTWEAPPYARTGKSASKCPYCSGRRAWQGFNDLKTVAPSIASEWSDALNGDLKPTQVTKGSHKKVWWECSAGHVWEAMIFARTKPNGTGCPICAGTVKTPKNDHTKYEYEKPRKT